MDLSIIIVNWNTRDLLERCLLSVHENIQTFKPANIQTFVVDNASIDGSPAMVRARFPWVRLIENDENLGFARANNQALRRTRGRYVLLLNSDTVLPPNALSGLIRFADSHPSAGIVGCKLVNVDGTFQAAQNDFPTLPSALLEAWGIAAVLYREPYFPSYPPHRSTAAEQCDWLGGACLLARNSAVQQVGLLDEGFFMNSEEVDWCYRMKAHGWEVWYTPDVEVVHLGGGSADRLGATQRMRLYAGKVRFIRKRYGPLAAWLLQLSYRLSSLLKALYYRMLFWLTRDDGCTVCAQSHWQAATTWSWT